jgi:hypothetical protein
MSLAIRLHLITQFVDRKGLGYHAEITFIIAILYYTGSENFAGVHLKGQ